MEQYIDVRLKMVSGQAVTIFPQPIPRNAKIMRFKVIPTQFPSDINQIQAVLLSTNPDEDGLSYLAGLIDYVVMGVYASTNNDIVITTGLEREEYNYDMKDIDILQVIGVHTIAQDYTIIVRVWYSLY